ncbi:hypothetical protein BH09PAT3_BH09PAT3_1490 [soil metagenome]
MRQRIATKALIVKDGKILLLREANTYEEGTNTGRYHLPGGRVEVGEPFQDALAREVMEETGLTITIGDPLYVGEWHPVIKGEENQIIAIFFVCTTTSDAVTLSEEHDDFVWIEPKNWRTVDVMDPEDLVIERYITLLSKV